VAASVPTRQSFGPDRYEWRRGRLKGLGKRTILANVAPISALLLGVALLQLGNGLQGTLLPVRAQVEAFTQLELGALGSAYFFGFVAGCYFGPWLVRNSGHIRTFTAMVALASALVLTHPLIVDPAFWLVARAATGVCFAVLYMVIESWLNARSTNTTRGVVFAFYAITSFGMLGMGQLLLPIDTPSGYPLFLIASILVSLAAVPVALSRPAEERGDFIDAVRVGQTVSTVDPLSHQGEQPHDAPPADAGAPAQT